MKQETQALKEMTEQIDDYFARQRLGAAIHDNLEKKISDLEIRLFLVDNHEEFQEFVQSHQAAQKVTEVEIKSTIKHVLDAQYEITFF